MIQLDEDLTMKRCTSCNYMERDGANFCSNCGNSSFEEQRDYYWAESESEEEIFREARIRRKKKMYSMLGVLGLIFLFLILFTAVKITLDNRVV